MKIDCQQILHSLVRNESTGQAPTNSKPSSPVQTDDVRLMNQEQLRSLLSKKDGDATVDSSHLASVAAKIVDGSYQVPAEQIADAILEETDLLREILK